MERIEINPKVMVGKPVIRGTRITVEHILELLQHGQTADAIIDEYPQLTTKDILAAIAYAKGAVAAEQVYSIRAGK